MAIEGEKQPSAKAGKPANEKPAETKADKKAKKAK